MPYELLVFVRGNGLDCFRNKYWTAKESESDRNIGDKTKCQKTVHNISLNIDLQIFSHNQSEE